MKLTFTTLFYAFILLMFSNAHAQKFEVFTDFEVGLPLSSSLKNFHDELANQIPYENVKTTDGFDYNYGFTIGFRFHEKASIFFNNRVSGAKSSVADYSGYIRLTNELNGYTLGLEYEILLKELKKGNLNLGFKGLITNSTLILMTESKILYTVDSESLEFKSWDFGGALGINYEYALGFVTLRAHLDLNIYLGGKITFKDDDSGAYLTDQNGNKLTTGWTGLTGGIGVIIPLFR